VLEDDQEVRVRTPGEVSSEQTAAVAAHTHLRKVAVLVCHGMGQQVPFQTLDCVAKLLTKSTEQHVHEVTLVNFGGKLLPRAELVLEDTQGPVLVHLYEAYWAPFTEGRVNTWDVIKFLYESAWGGLQFAARGEFDRWLFGKTRSLREQFRPGSTAVKILGALVIFSLLVILGLAVTLGGVALFALLLGLKGINGVFASAMNWSPVVVSGVWAVLLGLVLMVRYFLIQYVGDVAAYVSPYKVSKFDELRNQIQAAGEEVARCIYGLSDSSGKPCYGGVVVVGHSLGSVLAYDTLNRMIDEEMYVDSSLEVVSRTQALITFGSPLDKTAFIFRSHLKSAVFREALAGAKQPLIQSYKFRPDKWINIFSRLDVISGSLEFYDNWDEKNPKRIDNRVDKECRRPLLSHVDYWNHSALRKALYEGIGLVSRRNEQDAELDNPAA
jgi:pimeloyl-ACP methyl ester carboxylesterase